METFRIELILLDEEINSFIVVCNNKGHQVNKWYYLACGDGKLGGPNDGEAFIDIPDDLVIKDSHDPVGSLLDSIVNLEGLDDNFNESIYSPDVLQWASSFRIYRFIG
ncbi:hypothetical protein Tco_0991428 [Tanacetum coccineum]|uniref:Uncharacterized protein n=1 Tax=Tanacetum coccineum TaxID=301880 RepID=A0ABQ5F0A7_9ASTR